MLFSSQIFFIFFLIYFVAHLLTPKFFRLYLIIIGSSFFYAWWKIEYFWIPYFLMAIAYFGGQWISNQSNQYARKYRLIFIITLLFIPLLTYKYINFIYHDILGVFFYTKDNLFGSSLPLGVSFITFTLTAYLMDIYRKRYPSNKPILVVLAYVLFFPHLIAGPILHPKELIPQLENPRSFVITRTLVPLTIFSIGLFKKLVFADQIANLVVNPIYAQSFSPSGPEALLAIIGFAVQIFCDFSGYTDMAIALALLLGVKLPNNFERPYTATSISQLWSRWHITLTHFLMEYIFTPL